MSDTDAERTTPPHDPAALRLRAGLRVEILDAEALALDPHEGVVHRLEGAAARIVADLGAGRVPELPSPTEHRIVDALLEARILTAREDDGRGAD